MYNQNCHFIHHVSGKCVIFKCVDTCAIFTHGAHTNGARMDMHMTHNINMFQFHIYHMQMH
jgi:hypothetical protein